MLGISPGSGSLTFSVTLLRASEGSNAKAPSRENTAMRIFGLFQCSASMLIWTIRKHRNWQYAIEKHCLSCADWLANVSLVLLSCRIGHCLPTSVRISIRSSRLNCSTPPPSNCKISLVFHRAEDARQIQNPTQAFRTARPEPLPLHSAADDFVSGMRLSYSSQDNVLDRSASSAYCELKTLCDPQQRAA